MGQTCRIFEAKVKKPRSQPKLRIIRKIKVSKVAVIAKEHILARRKQQKKGVLYVEK